LAIADLPRGAVARRVVVLPALLRFLADVLLAAFLALVGFVFDLRAAFAITSLASVG